MYVYIVLQVFRCDMSVQLSISVGYYWPYFLYLFIIILLSSEQ